MPDELLKRRKEPRQARSAEMVRVIVEAAARILETRGLDGYNTNAVAEVAGVSVGSLYQYFPSKDAVTAALIAREKAQLLGEVAAIDLSDLAPKAPQCALRRLIAACVAHQMRRPSLARILDFEELRLPLPEHNANASLDLIGTLEAIVGALEVRLPAAPKTVAADCLAIIKGMNDAAGERGETRPDALQARIERAVFGYLQIATQAEGQL